MLPEFEVSFVRGEWVSDPTCVAPEWALAMADRGCEQQLYALEENARAESSCGDVDMPAWCLTPLEWDAVVWAAALEIEDSLIRSDRRYKAHGWMA